MISGIGTYRISSTPPLYNIIVELSAYLLQQRSEHSIIDRIHNEIYDHCIYVCIYIYNDHTTHAGSTYAPTRKRLL